jgi:hypothetical protein
MHTKSDLTSLSRSEDDINYHYKIPIWFIVLLLVLGVCVIVQLLCLIFTTNLAQSFNDNIEIIKKTGTPTTDDYIKACGKNYTPVFVNSKVDVNTNSCINSNMQKYMSTYHKNHIPVSCTISKQSLSTITDLPEKTILDYYCLS